MCSSAHDGARSGAVVGFIVASIPIAALAHHSTNEFWQSANPASFSVRSSSSIFIKLEKEAWPCHDPRWVVIPHPQRKRLAAEIICNPPFKSWHFKETPSQQRASAR